jgi:hypothetical protein
LPAPNALQENELLDLDPAPIFTVNKLTVGGIYDFFHTKNAKFGVGGLVSVYGIPDGLKREAIENQTI